MVLLGSSKHSQRLIDTCIAVDGDPRGGEPAEVAAGAAPEIEDSEWVSREESEPLVEGSQGWTAEAPLPHGRGSVIAIGKARVIQRFDIATTWPAVAIVALGTRTTVWVSLSHD